MSEDSDPHDPLFLRPRVTGQLGSLLADPAVLNALVRSLGSPLNIVLPEQLADNLHGFMAVQRRHRLTGRVCFAHKANRSDALLRRLAATSGSVDVASLGELQHALAAGFAPERIVATGPKCPEFCWLSARCGVTVGVDSVPELMQLAGIVRNAQLPRVGVLVRLTGFTSSGVTFASRPSRFGVPLRDLKAVAELLPTLHDAVYVRGVSYHLDSIGVAEKVIALQACLHALTVLRQPMEAAGCSAPVIDIGGGFGVNYLDDGTQWANWTSELTAAVLGRRPPMTWNGHGYGLRAENGTLRGTLRLYPSYRPVAGPEYLDQLLTAPAIDFDDRPLATVLLDHLYELWMEPGRSLVDQCGAVLTRVLEVRPGPGAFPLVRLDLNAGNMSAEAHGILMDPLLPLDPACPQDSSGPSQRVQGVYLLGNLCLESDLITRRVVYLPRLPRVGELMVFANTAGYLMDFSAAASLRQPLARTVAAWQEQGRWDWCLDEEYWPIPAGEHACPPGSPGLFERTGETPR